MGYATLMHVQARCPARPFSATSKPTVTQALQALDETAAELDGIVLAAGYQLPVPTTATQALAVLLTANAAGAWARVEAAAQVSEDKERATKEWERWQRQLNPTEKGPTIELDLSRQTTEGRSRAGTIGSAYFTRDDEF